ncbi:MAG: hypothetical protein CENE_01665 [Candidatus Celerinatantimonas neptuna]|nr:MAG: hypothetical protein CENE_01665 [Candidatus Celerinatantimonas neptuna]
MVKFDPLFYLAPTFSNFRITVFIHTYENRINVMNNQLIRTGFAIALLGMGLTSAHATENGNVQYGLGGSQFFGGAIPPISGIYIDNQVSYYSANRTNDGSGHQQDVDFDADVWVNTFRLFYVTDHKVLKGRVWYQGVLPVVLSQKITVKTPVATIQDVEHHGLVDPLVGGGLRWGQGHQTYILGLSVVMPLGTGAITEHHWSAQPAFGYHYLNIRHPGWEIASLTRYIMNTKNTKTDYRSGQTIESDYGVGYYFGKLRLGVAGYWLYQTTDDSGSGVGSDGHRTDVFAIGPSAKWMFKKGEILSGSVQREVYTKNRSQGTTVWLNYAFKF